MTDSPLATKWVPAPDVWSRNGAPIRGIAIHMAEGGGTVSWLTRDDGNSSHYVVEYSGRIVQMVAESKAAGSMNPRATRTTDDAPFTYEGTTVRYGRTALNRALGGYATNPNAASIAIEVEGFAKDGPNAAQRDALRRLVADIRRRHGPLPCFGHRDQQDYKACPGKRIPWGDYGGHAVSPQEDDTVRYKIIGAANGTVVVPGGRGIINLNAGGYSITSFPRTFRAHAVIQLEEPDNGRDKGYLVGAAGVPFMALNEVVESYTPEVSSGYTQADIDAAIAADRKRIADALPGIVWGPV